MGLHVLPISDNAEFNRRVMSAASRAAAEMGGDVHSEWVAGFAQGYRDALEQVDNAAGVLFNLDAMQVKRTTWVTDTVRYGHM